MAENSIRLLHFADAHVGIETYGATDPETGLSSRVRDFFERLYEIRDYAAEHDADLVIFAGDAFKTRNPTPTFQREFARFVRDLARQCPVLLLVGNHDLPTSANRASSVEIYHTLDVPNTLVGFDYGLRRVETKRGPVQIATAPYPFRSRLLDERRTRGATLEDIDHALQHELETILRDLAQQADQDPAPRVLAGHFSVQGSAYGSERGVMIGRDIAVSLDALANPAWDYVALGHIHRRQSLPNDANVPVVYSGSVERIDFGEEGDPKGFCWVELARGAAAWRFVDLHARPFVTLRVDAHESANPTAEAIRQTRSLDLSGAVVRVIVRLSEGNAALLRDSDLRRALANAGANHVAAIQKDVERSIHARLGGSPEKLTPDQLLKRYLEVRGTPPGQADKLLAAAREVFEEE